MGVVIGALVGVGVAALAVWAWLAWFVRELAKRGG
jgi:hypothetical protein